MEYLTTSEAAVAAGVSVPQIQRMIDEKILPEDLYRTAQMRTFRTDACVLIAFYFETADLLTASARQRAIRNALEHCQAGDSWKNCTFEEHFVTVRFSDFSREVDDRLHQLARAREAVVEDPEILGGTPVFKGTRVPAYDVAAMVEADVPLEEILESYPSLKDWQIKLALVYARAVPPKGRPKRTSSNIPGVKSYLKKRLRPSSIGG
ncbi:DUF433 domain-containing protein [Acidicapsa ligni]|uniref:DUF433 domain-containing protein n=1 Tax=Acidicapsa ligni TaxID=542300 RepID=UPI0021DFAF37|nr:DUF433 domain-containing protein [Acidicapsa ligni]